MNLEAFSFKSIFEENCDVIKEWLNEDQIERVKNLEIRVPTGNVYDEEGGWDEKATLVALWEDKTYELISQDLLSWARLKEFYQANQQVIVETFRPSSDYEKLYAAMADGYDTESSMVCIAAFAAYHWSFGYWYRAKRLERQSEKQESSDSPTPPWLSEENGKYCPAADAAPSKPYCL